MPQHKGDLWLDEFGMAGRFVGSQLVVDQRKQSAHTKPPLPLRHRGRQSAA